MARCNESTLRHPLLSIPPKKGGCSSLARKWRAHAVYTSCSRWSRQSACAGAGRPRTRRAVSGSAICSRRTTTGQRSSAPTRACTKPTASTARFRQRRAPHPSNGSMERSRRPTWARWRSPPCAPRCAPLARSAFKR
ncbi:hypothetical protein T492DRAFT_976835 [Pavlovales sp. CCMP2436]|nr:hypothetical protein T492DRAFT_976835 [Pavlovales sp. CCMP2436]